MQIGLLAYRLISADCLLNWCHFDVKLSDVLAATIYICLFMNLKLRSRKVEIVGMKCIVAKLS